MKNLFFARTKMYMLAGKKILQRALADLLNVNIKLDLCPAGGGGLMSRGSDRGMSLFAFSVITAANKVWDKVIFSQASVITSVHRGRGLHQVGRSASRWEGVGQTSAPPPGALQDMINKRATHILLECIPVIFEPLRVNRP